MSFREPIRWHITAYNGIICVELASPIRQQLPLTRQHKQLFLKNQPRDFITVFGVWIRIEMRIVVHRYDTDIYMQFQRNDKKIFWSSLQKLLAQKKTIQWTDASNCVYFMPQNLLFYADKSILRAVIWLVQLMHALYSNHIGYNETRHTYLACVEWSAILGVPLRFQKRPIRSSIHTVQLGQIFY